MHEKPYVLITNDDGIDAPGIRAMVEAIKDLAHVVVVAPSSDRSGSSCSLTLRQQIRIVEHKKDWYAVCGTPVDCVLLGTRKILPRIPDWILSGINYGPNLGDDTHFSGTVGAAIIGGMLGVSTMAVSMGDFTEPLYYDSGQMVVRQLFLARDHLQSLKGRTLNVNVPNLPLAKIKGLRMATLSRRYYHNEVMVDGSDSTLHKYSTGKVQHDNSISSDTTALEEGYVALTVLKPSLLAENENEKLEAFLPRNLMELQF